MTARHVVCGGLLVLAALVGAASALVQTSPETLRTSIDKLGDFDYAVRMEASRTVRRVAPEVAGPVLLDAVRHHEDSYIQFRALVLLYGLDDFGARAIFEEVLGSPNDRLRVAAYGYFEQQPDRTLVPKLLAAVDAETSEFVRPTLVRALAAHDDDDAVRDRLVRDIDRGEAYFRGAVIEALGDHDATYAVDALIRIATEGGPLQDDALLALGKLGGSGALAAVRSVQEKASETLQPIVSSAACLLEVDCSNQLRYVIDALRYGANLSGGGSQALLRSAASGLAALAMRGHRDALDALFEIGFTSTDAARAPIALAAGTVALRTPGVVQAALTDRVMPDGELLLLRDAFDMLDEDLAEERFYVLMRHAYWAAAEGSSERRIAEAAIQVLEF